MVVADCLSCLSSNQAFTPPWPNLNFLDLISDSEGEEGQIKALEHPSLTQHACQGQQPSSGLRLACTWWASALFHEPDFSESLSGFSQLINSECCACVCLYMTPAVGLILTDWLSQLKLLPLYVWLHPSDLWQLLIFASSPVRVRVTNSPNLRMTAELKVSRNTVNPPCAHSAPVPLWRRVHIEE